MIKIAIADDHALFRKGIVNIIQDFEGIEVIMEASNGLEIVEKVKLAETKPDVILMDLKMPELDGIEATEEIHQLLPDIKILILSMHDEEQFILHMMENGANGYLLKDSEPDELEKAIRGVVGEEFYFDEYVVKIMHKGLLKRKRVKPMLDESKVFFSERELEVLELICKEKTAQEIGKVLFISPRTVDGHRNKLLEKTGAKNTVGLVVYAIKNKLVDIGA